VREKPKSRESGGPVAEPVEGSRASGGDNDRQRHTIESALENAQEPKRHCNDQNPKDRLGHGKWRTRSEESNMPHSLDCFACQEPGDEESGDPGKGGKAVSADVVSHLLNRTLTAAAPSTQPLKSKPPQGSISRRWRPSLGSGHPLVHGFGSSPELLGPPCPIFCGGPYSQFKSAYRSPVRCRNNGSRARNSWPS